MTQHQPGSCSVSNCFRCVLLWLINWPERVTAHFLWAGPLVARLVVGYVFMLTGWGKLNNLPQVIEYFIGWGIPFPHILTPFVASVEFFGGLFLILGLFTRIAGGMLSGVMVVAIISAKLSDIDSLETLLGFEEASYFALFFGLAVLGAGKVSLDHFISRKLGAAISCSIFK
jgi:putative oxidoreductase